MNKLNSFQSFIYSTDYDLICITETWLCENIFDGEIIPKGYSIFRKDRGSRGGGILVATKESINVMYLSSPQNLEVLPLIINLTNAKSISICSIYIPPNLTTDTFQPIITYLSDFMETSDNVILLGDFNLPDINWSTLTGSTTTSQSFCDFIFQYNLTQSITSPTHIKGNILDLIYSQITLI